MEFKDFHRYKCLRSTFLWKICEYQSSLGTLKKFKHRPALTNIKYNCGVLFLVKCIAYVFFPVYFLHVKYHHCITQSELTELLKTVRIYWNSCRVLWSQGLLGASHWVTAWSPRVKDNRIQSLKLHAWNLFYRFWHSFDVMKWNNHWVSFLHFYVVVVYSIVARLSGEN